MSKDFRRGIKVYLDAQEFKGGIDQMVKATAVLEKELQELAAKGENLTRKEIQQKARLERSIQNNTKAVADFKEKTKETEKVLNNLSGTAYDDLVKVQRQLEKEMRGAERGTQKFNTALEQHKRVTNEVNKAKKEMNMVVGAQGNIFAKATGFVNKYWAVVAGGIAAITGVSMRFRKLAEDVAHMDDVYSDVMKTTGNTREQVLALNEEFKEMDTRTSRESLNLLARDAGKLGLNGSKDILDFVEAGNQINVALGEDLGEDAIKNIGKMVGVFDKSTEHLRKLDLKGQMLAVGSAINELGASSSANEGYLVQFAGRLGGVASQAGISIDEILGYASALDQDMQQVEMSATALQNFIMKIMGEPAKFAQLAKMEVGAFTKLLNTDANAAIKAVLRSLNEQGGFQQLIPVFQEMGLDGARAVGVLSSMAGSIDKIDEAQRLANQSLVEGNSLTTEYNIKNENLAAKLEKARKAFKEKALELGEKLNPILLKSTNLTTNLIKLITKYPGILKTIGGAIGTIAVVYGILLAERIKNNIALKAGIVLEKAKLISTNLLAVGKHLLAGNTAKATVAWYALNTAMKANVILAVIGAVVGLGMAVYKLATRTTEAEKATESFYEDLAKEQSTLQSLVDEYSDVNTKKERKLKLIQQLESQYGVYLDDLKDEEGLITDIAIAQFRANKQLQDNLALKGKQQFIDDAQQDFFKDQMKNVNKFKSAMEDAGLSDYQVGEFASRINTMFRDSGADVNKTMRIAADFMEDQGVTVNSAMRKSMQAMAKSANEMNVAKREAEETFNVFLSNGDNILDELVVTPGKKKGGGGNSPSPGGTTTKGNKTDPADIALKAAEESYKAELLALKNSLIEKEITETQFAEKGETLHLQHLNSKLKIQKEYNKSTVDTETEIANWKLNKQKTEDEHRLDGIKMSNDAKLLALAEFDALQKQQLQDEVDAGTITNSQYQARLQAIELTSAQTRLQVARDYLAEVEDSEFHSAEAKEKAVKEAAKAVESAVKDEEKAVKSSNKAKLKSEEQYQKDRESLLKQLGLLSIREQYELEKKELDKHLADKLITEQEHAEAVRKLKAEKAGAYAQQAVEIANGVADAVNAYHKMEADSLEAAKQRELTAAGDNAEAREAIEQKYAQKELDLKKKQANADAGIKIAQAFANAALAISSIWAVHAANPILAGILTGLSATTTAFQIASIIKQRNAIMATTLDSSGGSPSPTPTGALVPNSQLPATSQAADGRYDVIGEDDHRTYRNVPYAGAARSGIIRTPTLVAERGDELIVSNPHLRRIQMNEPDLIHRMMRHRVPQRADGKYDSVQSAGGAGINEVLAGNMAAMRELSLILKYLKENGIDAYVLISELEKTRAKRDKAVKLGGINV